MRLPKSGFDRFFCAVILSVLIFPAILFSAPEWKPFDHASQKPGAPFPDSTKEVFYDDLPRPKDIPDEFSDRAQKLLITDFVDIALRLNPATQSAWQNARMLATQYGGTRGAYYPSLQAGSQDLAGKIPQSLGGNSFISANATLNYLLLDFGGRSATVTMAREALNAANYTHNQVIQDVLRNVPQAYYRYVGYKALITATSENVADAKTSLDSAREREKAGVGTISEVLQAQATYQQALYDLADAKGNAQIEKGNLAIQAGLAPQTLFEIAPGSLSGKLALARNDVRALIEEAYKNRPDLKAAWADVRKKEAEIRKNKSAMYPQVTATGTSQWMKSRAGDANAYYGGLGITIPLFQGGALKNAVRGAEAGLAMAKATGRQKEDTVAQEVWKAYQTFVATGEQLVAAQAQLASARESYAASLERYRTGVGNIVELMQTLAQLATSRAQLIRTQMDYYTEYADLIHAVGAEFSSWSPGEDAGTLAVEVGP